jgi:LysM repeat protein
MTKTPPSASSTRLCPTCGTRVGAAATKCLVCGADLTIKTGARSTRPGAAALPRSAPLRLPSAWLILLVVVLVAGSVVAYLFYNGTIKLPQAPVAQADVTVTVTPTVTNTLPPTFTAQPTATETQAPTDTPQPPLEYAVQAGDTCVSIAAQYNVSWQSIVTLNSLDPNCNLSVGRILLIPLPTPTPSPLPTATLGAVVATQVPRLIYTVHSGDTLLGIAGFYGVTVADLMEVNGITDPTSIRPGDTLIIPIERAVTPGPTPTATPPPPWPAPNQLQPADGQAFAAADVITLQWASVGALRPGEFYFVVLEDVTCNCARYYRQPTTDTKLIVPSNFRHTASGLRVYRWTVTTVRQTSPANAPFAYDAAGATSPGRVFVWMGDS